jgi:hypothetical protein
VSSWGSVTTTFQRELALAGLLLAAPLTCLPAEAEDKKSTSSAPVRAAKTIENTRQRNKEAEAAGARPITTSTSTTTTSNIDKARNRIQSTLPADGAVRADPANKPSVVGVQASEFKPSGPKLKPLGEPPRSGTPNFPKRPANEPALTNPATR